MARINTYKVFPVTIIQGRLKLKKKQIKKYSKLLLAKYVKENEKKHRITADSVEQNLHEIKSFDSLFSDISDFVKECLFEYYHFSNKHVKFYIGRSWPVIQQADGQGNFHYHHGAVFSGVAYLKMPKGSGGLVFTKHDLYVSDRLPRAKYHPSEMLNVEILPEAGDIVLFNSELRHAALPSSNLKSPRIAVSFDVFASVSLQNSAFGLPHIDHLLKIDKVDD